MSPKLKAIMGYAFAALLIFLLAATLIVLRMGFRLSDARYVSKLADKGIAATIRYSEGQHPVRTVISGREDGELLVFIHGAPGSSKDFQRYLADTALAARFRMYAVDRPGYGYSGYGKVCTSILEQADRIARALPDSAIVVGHSYGGPVASALAMQHPQKVRRLILLAPAAAPEHEKKMFINRIISVKPLWYLLGGAVRVAVAEKQSHVEALKQLLPYWQDIHQPVTLLHGQADRIVPVENAAFLQRQLANAPLDVSTPEGMGHIMIWTDYETVRDLLLEVVVEDD